MSEASREQRPLLCEELSEEEHFTEYPRRHRPMIYRGRARNNIKGAAAIITRWPDHWSSTLTYWWMGLSMMALIIFLIYNTLIAFVLLPPAHMSPINPRISKSDNFNTQSHLPEVYMHVFANTAEEVDVNKYLPYIELISDKHLDFNFNLIIVYNDTGNEANALSAEANNDIAFNAIWDKEHFYTRKINNRKNVKIKHVVLSHYMDSSPLRKDWRRIPNQFLEFLVKAVSIWDKGGIAINPSILTPSLPHVIYIEKIQNILQKFSTRNEIKPVEIKTKKYANKHKDKYKKKVNNIRDIIDILEHEDSLNYNQNNLTEAEDRDNAVIHNGRKLLSTTLVENKNMSRTELSEFVIVHPETHSDFKKNGTQNKDDVSEHKLGIVEHNVMGNLVITNESYKNPHDINHTSKLSLLPLFLEFLFHDKSDETPKIQAEGTGEVLARHRKNAVPVDKQKHGPANNSVNKTEGKANESLKPMIIPAKGIIPAELFFNNDTVYSDIKYENVEELTIDLKGNVIATKTPCHAFIGTIFSNIVHHSAEETLRDFIIVELSLFCKGLLSSCRGIDVILL